MSTNNGNAEGGNSSTANTSNDDQNAKGEFEPITSQEDFDKRLGARLHEERSKYKDYDDLKEKASKYDEVTESQKTELEKANERAAAAESKLAEYETAKKVSELRKTIRKEKGIPEDMEALLTATDEEEMKKQADLIAGNLSKNKKTVVKSDNGKNYSKNESNSELADVVSRLRGGN